MYLCTLQPYVGLSMKNFKSSDIVSLLFIAGIGCFELFYRKNFTDGYLALGMVLILLTYQINNIFRGTI
jgi:hypothetical protein